MLVLSRKVGEVINIGSTVTVTVLSYDRGIVRLGITAPKSVAVHRKEVHDRIVAINRIAARTQIEALKSAMQKNKVSFSTPDEQEIASLNISATSKKGDTT